MTSRQLKVRAAHGFWSSEELRLHFLDYGGAGRPIVLLHGVTGHAGLWCEVAPKLTDLGRVIAVDLRGHGDSQWSNLGNYDTNSHVRDLRELIDLLGHKPVDLVGLSWGALVATRFTAETPGDVRRLAIIDIPMSFSQGVTEIPQRPATFRNHREAVSYEQGASPRASSETLEAMAFLGTRPATGGHLARKHDPFFTKKWPFRADDLWDEYGTLQAPLLVVHATDSNVFSVEEAEHMAAIQPGATSVEIPECGHLVPVEAPDALAEALYAFLRY